MYGAQAMAAASTHYTCLATAVDLSGTGEIAAGEQILQLLMHRQQLKCDNKNLSM